jgi:hypothetical protein
MLVRRSCSGPWLSLSPTTQAESVAVAGEAPAGVTDHSREARDPLPAVATVRRG